MRLLLLLLLAAASLPAAISVGTCAFQSCTGANCTTPDATINSSGATMLWLTVGRAGGSDANSDIITDGQTNTWNHLASVINSISTTQFYAYSKGSSALATSSTHTIHVRGDYASFVVCPVSGTVTYPTNPFDTQPTPTSSASTTSLATGSITCSQASSVIFSSMAAHATWSTAYAINSGFALAGGVNYASGLTAGLGGGYLVQTSAAAVNPTWSGLSIAGNMATTIACFKGAAAAPPTTMKRRFVMEGE